MTTALAREPIQTEDAAHIIQHVNEDHVAELLLCVRAFTDVQHPTDVQLTSLYPDGAQGDVTSEAGQRSVFIPYSVQGPAHEAIRATVAAAMKKLGLKPEQRVAQWQITETRALTPHFRRLILDLGDDERADWAAGYACRFALPDESGDGQSPASRPYTLRRVDAGRVAVDVYCHDDTPGSRWAVNLKSGDVVTVAGGRHESFPDFSAGPGLLLGDETALPTIGALLEGWTHGHPLRVLLEVGDAADGRYLDEVRLPPDCEVTWLVRGEQPGLALVEAVKGLEPPPAAVWGATEAEAAKGLRTYLKTTCGLSAQQGRVTGYWRAL